LTLAEVIKHYGYKADKYNRICCPFHDDKNPSMQLYWKTHTAYCFSSNCKLNGKSIDVIDFILHKENSTKHEAIQKAKTMITGEAQQISSTVIQGKEQFLQKMFTYFKNGLHSSNPGKDYISFRNLDFKKLEIGYNASQFHHGTRKDETLINQCLQYGLLIDGGLTSRTGEKAYNVFGRMSICFALKNRSNQITGLYFRSTVNNDKAKHFYLKDRKGLYPNYPKESTKKLILTEAIIDAASLLQYDEIISQYSVLAAYGTNGLTEEHTGSIKELKELEEIIFFFDGDNAGREAVNKYATALKSELPHITITSTEPPEGEDINSLLVGHNPEILTHLLQSRKLFTAQETKAELFFSNEVLPDEKKNGQAKPTVKPIITEKIKEEVKPNQPKLNIINPYNILYNGSAALYSIKGGQWLKQPLEIMKIAVQIINTQTKQDYRSKADLYEYKQLHALALQASEKLNIKAEQAEKDLSILTHLLEEYREQQQINPNVTQQQYAIKIGESTQAKCIDFLSKAELIKRINELIGKAGVVGEENNRIFLFVIASSYKMKNTLHALIQGSSGSGKTRLLKVISELMPMEDVKKYTRVTDSSFYNQEEYFFVNKLVCFEDYDGLKEDAQLAVRELQSNEILITSTSVKDESGKISGGEKTVRGPIASMGCTTKGELYEDNISRCFVIAVDESKEQTKRVIHYQNNVAAGIVDKKKERDIREFLQNCIRLLKPYEVVNPFANRITLPEEAHKIRRLNELYQCLVKQITLLNQYQRKKDEQGRLISTKEDLQTACEIMFESILLKVDELDGALRQFYEKLKTFVEKQGKEYEFNRFEIRQATGVSKTQQHVYMSRLAAIEYVHQYGFANRGFKYKIAHWDNMAAVRAKIKDSLQNQLQAL
ncbi:MAG: toprim domain-containing protein, partial [Bacteroidetes bacterium]|nr:toprim domain-containing protein [Bacteroidota bacterium]